MRMKLNSLALLAALCTSGANAQDASGVTIYGFVSTGVAHSDNVAGGSLTSVINGPFGLSRIGFRGTEDLGGGTRAFFLLESGINSDTGAFGQGGRAFGRGAYVGLESTAAGTLTLGRQVDALATALCVYKAACLLGGYGIHVGDNDNAFNTFRLNNAITYRTPTWAGLQLTAQYAFAESATNKKDNRVFSGAATYKAGNFAVAAGTMTADRPGSSTNAAGAVTGDYGFSSPFTVSRVSGAAVQQQRANAIGASYKFPGDTLLSGNYSRSEFRYVDASGVDNTNAEIFISKYLMPQLQAGMGYSVTESKYTNGLSPWKWGQLTANVNYWLSKRTSVSASFVHQKARGVGNVAWIYSVGRSSDDSQNSIAIGIRNVF